MPLPVDYYQRQAEIYRNTLYDKQITDLYAKQSQSIATPPPQVPPATPPAPAAAAPLDPQQLAAALYDKEIPIGVATRSQWGGRIVEGPVFGVVNNERVVSFIAGYYIPINFWSATRTVSELYFRGQLAWTLGDGALLSGLNVGVPTVNGVQTVRFATGTLAQTPDAWSVARYGARATAYVPLVTATFENIRIAQFGNVVPFTSVTVDDTAYGTPGDLVAWADAIEALARYEGRGPDEFETVDVTGGMSALILGSNITFIDFLGVMRKHKPQWNVRTADKLYLVEKGSSLDLTLDLAKLVDHGAQPITVHTSDAFDNPREKICHYLDVSRDYEPSNVRVAEDIDPVISTDSFSTDRYDIPVASTADIVMNETSYAYYTGEVARQQSEFSGMAYYLGLEPGDCYKWTTAGGRVLYHRVNEIVRRADFTLDVKGEGFLNCAIEDSRALCALFMGGDFGSGDAVTANFGASSFAGSVPSGFVSGLLTTFNPTDMPGSVGSIAFSNDNLTATVSIAGFCGARSVRGFLSGKRYWENTIDATATNSICVGVCPGSHHISSAGFNGVAVVHRLGGIFVDGVNVGTLAALNVGDIIGIAVDFSSALIWFRIAPSGNWNGSGTADPAIGAGGISISALSLV
jgi:hypothetical protein